MSSASVPTPCLPRRDGDSHHKKKKKTKQEGAVTLVDPLVTTTTTTVCPQSSPGLSAHKRAREEDVTDAEVTDADGGTHTIPRRRRKKNKRNESTPAVVEDVPTPVIVEDVPPPTELPPKKQKTKRRKPTTVPDHHGSAKASVTPSSDEPSVDEPSQPTQEKKKKKKKNHKGRRGPIAPCLVREGQMPKPKGRRVTFSGKDTVATEDANDDDEEEEEEANPVPKKRKAAPKRSTRKGPLKKLKVHIDLCHDASASQSMGTSSSSGSSGGFPQGGADLVKPNERWGALCHWWDHTLLSLVATEPDEARSLWPTKREAWSVCQQWEQRLFDRWQKEPSRYQLQVIYVARHWQRVGLRALLDLSMACTDWEQKEFRQAFRAAGLVRAPTLDALGEEACVRRILGDLSAPSHGSGQTAAPQWQCPECSSTRVSMKTIICRSSDEGETTFYSCQECSYKERTN